jgi:hypothetical protein
VKGCLQSSERAARTEKSSPAGTTTSFSYWPSWWYLRPASHLPARIPVPPGQLEACLLSPILPLAQRMLPADRRNTSFEMLLQTLNAQQFNGMRSGLGQRNLQPVRGDTLAAHPGAIASFSPLSAKFYQSLLQGQ